jgi:hypothetical protein
VGQAKDAQAGRAGDANALRIYHGNFDTALHDPERAPLGATTEAVASLPMLVLAGADDGCIPPLCSPRLYRSSQPDPADERRWCL